MSLTEIPEGGLLKGFFSVVALTNIPEGELLTGFAIRGVEIGCFHNQTAVKSA